MFIFIQHGIFKVVAMTYKIQNEERKSETPPPRNAERSKEPIADIEDEKQVQEKFKNIPAPADSEKSKEPIADIEDDKQVQKDNYKTIPVPSPLYNICMILNSQDKELEKLIKDLKCLGREEDGVIGRFEASCQLDYSNNPMLFQWMAMQDREANRKLLLEELRQLSAGFRQKQDEAFRRFKSKIWTPPISKFASDVKTANIKQPPAAEETMETSSSAETTKVAPVAFKEERSSCEEKETLNVPVPTENQLKCMDGSMEEEVVITTEGGLIEIQDTGVSLEIPPGALVKEQLIKMRIVSEDYHDELAVSFGSNASVVVELLPSNLALLKPAKLTLPHCLVLKKGCEWKAKIYTSHHEKGKYK
ncbi:hypothetical protein BSL78_21457 [Apostichopus japonicus]|uniref:ZU5 domain-containing protein n=1 Tax=Stichopus japonicus TaxID=307972 RepID=A0A2G8K107_STIJA|nr:hypothetical protein BSL78_21457 [Apostichopus japonicus]